MCLGIRRPNLDTHYRNPTPSVVGLSVSPRMSCNNALKILLVVARSGAASHKFMSVSGGCESGVRCRCTWGGFGFMTHCRDASCYDMRSRLKQDLPAAVRRRIRQVPRICNRGSSRCSAIAGVPGGAHVDCA